MTAAPATTVQRASPWRVALPALARCVVQTGRLLARGDLEWPREHVGMRIGFADGTSAAVFRETVRRGAPARDPCVLVVEFQLHWLRGWTHALFRAESICNTPLFAGFPGFVTKLWLAHDQRNVYRGLYEWDGAERAEHYARSLWRVLAIGSVRGSIRYTVIPGARRGDMLPPATVAVTRGAHEWWRVTTAASRTAVTIARDAETRDFGPWTRVLSEQTLGPKQPCPPRCRRCVC